MTGYAHRWSPATVGYCTNVHPCHSLDDAVDIVRNPLLAVRVALGQPVLGCGLWLPKPVATSLDDQPVVRERLLGALVESGIQLVTLNGFPYGDFHQAAVKDSVYLPSWADSSRLDYTLALARFLSQALSAGREHGSISSVPLGYARRWSADLQQQAMQHLYMLVEGLAALEDESGKLIRVGLEMEPDCVLESTEQAIQFFGRLVDGASVRGLNEEKILRYLGVCYDCCHQAVMHEDIAQSLVSLCAAGLSPVKIQLSNAIKLTVVDGPSASALRELVDQKYLHQCVSTDDGRERLVLPDLTVESIETMGGRGGAWRIHYHVPIDQRELCIAGQSFGTTQAELLHVLAELPALGPIPPDLEVETYTWSQWLNVSRRSAADVELLTGLISNELRWLYQQLAQRHLLA